MKILLIIEQCNPEWASVPLVGYRYYQGISKFVQTTLVTHERNRAALSKRHADQDIIYISESHVMADYYQIASRISRIGNKIIWPLHNTLTYPIYAEFDWKVFRYFKEAVAQRSYDIVHAITPMMPRYPVTLIAACKHTPFLIGPVNGGVPFPAGFRKTAMQEFAYFNFLRLVGRWIIPGYRRTYQKATKVLAGSSYTLSLLKDLFAISDDRICLFYENGITSDFLRSDLLEQKEHNQVRLKASEDDRIILLFVGRLVPYKGADMIIAALDRLAPNFKARVCLRIVGDGSERIYLENLVKALNLTEQVEFVGWVPQAETRNYYQSSDIFCFPSVREFGGAVVLEAMASGLPCIVVNNGGIGEYVTEKTGFRIEPRSREYVISQLKQHLEQLLENPDLRYQMSISAIERASEFTWERKIEKILDLYQEVLAGRESPA